MLPETFLLTYYNHQCMEIKLQKLFITDLIQDFFSTSVQFHDFSGPEKSKLKFQYFSGPTGTMRFTEKKVKRQKTVKLVH